MSDSRPLDQPLPEVQHPLGYGGGLILIAVVLFFCLFDPIDFVYNVYYRLNSNYMDQIMSYPPGISDYILNILIAIITPIAYISFFKKKTTTARLMIICMSLSLF